MKLSKLLSDFDGQIFFSDDTEIFNVTSNSKSCVNGSLYISIKGLKHDGHEYIPEAVSLGAVFFVIQSDAVKAKEYLTGSNLPFAVCDDTRKCEAILCARFFGDPQNSLKISAVTGTNGKTTVVSLLHSIYSSTGIKAAAMGTLTGALTTLDPSQLYSQLASLRDAGVTHVFMEASSHGLYFNKLAPITFENGIFTNLSSEHLDFHRTMDEYAKAKAKLFKMSKRCIINVDDPYASVVSNGCKNVYTCSQIGSNADFQAKNAKNLGKNGISYHLLTKDLIFKIRSSTIGMFSVMNTLQASACAVLDGISHRVIRSALLCFKGVKGRLEKIPLPTNDFSLYIDFAHTPDALKKLLQTVRSFMSKGQRLVLLFGCGGDRDKSKRAIMGDIASHYCDFVVITSDNSRSEKSSDIISQIMSGFDRDCPHTVIENRKTAIEYAVSTAQHGDIIILAGKGHEEYELQNGVYLPFSERQIAQNALLTRLKGSGS